ncbi:hypothetical protein [Bradyrhizobium neotropicale]|uniref:hypothetical protein n=1 Tax=Bradyrhizobium neotropicale TaxID=1497615 RepID=UPI0011AB7C67|nr:hypothetical protein [Bradyrhizobium neotropicale]
MADRSGTHSDLAVISKLNGDFRKNYGTLLGAFLYLRSMQVAGGRASLCSGLLIAALSALLSWFAQHGWR